MQSADGKQRLTDVGDKETILRLVQSIPSPKAEPIKQWLAKVGAQRLDEVTEPLDAGQVSAGVAAARKPALEAPALAWAEYYEQLAALYRRQAAYETRLARLAYVDATLDARLSEHDRQIIEYGEQIGALHSRMEGLEEGQRMFAELPELLERMGPRGLTPEHQASAKAMAVRLHELSGLAFAAIYGELNAAFHVGRYSDIPDARWSEVTAWFKPRLDAAA